MLKNQHNCIIHLFPGRVLECFRFSFHLLQSISYKMLLSETITQFSTIKKKTARKSDMIGRKKYVLLK